MLWGNGPSFIHIVIGEAKFGGENDQGFVKHSPFVKIIKERKALRREYRIS